MKLMLIQIDKYFAYVDEIGFLGDYSKSQNGLFTIAWSDFDKVSGIGGFRMTGEGTYLIAKKNEVLHIGKMQRPNECKISNNGNFIVNDWLFGEGLKGIFYAFDYSGSLLIKKRFSANLYNNGIAEDGNFAVSQTCNSDSQDSNILCFFNLEKKSLLWKIQPTIGWASSYYFDCEKMELHLNYKEKGSYRYSFNGEFIDREKWELEKINFMSAFEISRIAKKRFVEEKYNLNATKAEKILSLFDTALSKGLDKYPKEKAIIYRTKGEIMESLGRTDDAIQLYELAVELNPKIGIKRHLKEIKESKD
jgi:tetratricopeptide (TPR) repeat protein